MSNKTLKPFMLATGAVLLGGLAISQSAFAVKQLGSGYQVTTPDGTKATEGKCGAEMKMTDGKMAEGKCGAGMMAGGKMSEGKCGGMMMMADKNKDGIITKAEHRVHADAMFAKMDANKDGKVTSAEMKAGGEGKCGADKK